MRQWRLFAFLAFNTLLAAGCHLPSGSGAKRLPLPPAVAAEFNYSRPDGVVCQETNLASKRGYFIKTVEVTSPSGQGAAKRSLVLDYFVPQTDGKHPVLLILPMLGGSYPLEKYFATYFVKRGFASIIVHREKPPKNATFEILDGLLKQSVLDNRQAIDWIETRPELDAQRIGVFGISMGGIKAALLAPLEPRIRAATLGLAGGDVPYILTYTTENGLSKRRDAILREQHLTPLELHGKIGQCIHCDPNAVAPFMNPEKVLLVLGAFDTVVPINKGLELRNKLGKPETIVVPTGHYSAILFLPYIQHRCYKFFEKKLAPQPQMLGKAK